MEERAFHPLDYLSVLRRRKWWLIVPVALSIVVGLVLAAMWPKTYLSQAEIGIAAPTLSPELLKGVSSLNREERQQAITQQLVSRQVLERVVKEEKLNPSKPVEDVATWLKDQVKVAVDLPIGRNAENKLDSFKLGYIDASPERAQRITNRLAHVFVEENSKSRIGRAENTSEELGRQVEASLQRLTALEAQLRVKKEANMGRLPDQVTANVSMANGLRQSYESYSIQLRTEQERLSQLEAQIQEMEKGSAGAPTLSIASTSAQKVQSRINDLQQSLTAERAVGKTDRHPDIIALNEELATARAELATVKQPTGGATMDLLRTDPAYQQRVQERDATRLRINTLRAQAAQANAQIAQYQSRVEAAPMVEQDLASVQRDVALEKTRYENLKASYDNAQTAERVAHQQGGERFSVLYPAYPGRPTDPTQQVKLFLVTVALGIGLGGALVLGREFLDRSVHDARALQNEFQLPVLGEIPKINRAA
jgi:polysaccharide chain length determinant protein (PEP-CTERM system associated)